MKKIFYSMVALLVMGLTLAACGSDDDNNTTTTDEAKYKDRTYGNAAIQSCMDVISSVEDANSAIASASLTTEQESSLRSVLQSLVSNVIVPT